MSEMNSAVAAFATTEGMTFFHPDNGVYNVRRDHPEWAAILRAVRAGDIAAAIKIVDKAQLVTTHLGSLFAGDIDPYTGVIKPRPGSREITPEISEAVRRLVANGMPAEPLRRCLEKLSENPHPHAWRETLLFCDKNGFQIFDDGDILGYKGVTSDFKDLRTRTFDNTPGARVTMPRHQVDDDRRVSCSTGLHVAAHEYAHSFAGSGGNVVVVKVHPADIVSIPYDYDNQKMRTCGYTVVRALQPKDEPLRNNANVFRLNDLLRQQTAYQPDFLDDILF